MSLYQRLSYRMWFVTAGTLAGAGKTFAQVNTDFGGAIPAIPGTPEAITGNDARDIILRILAFVLDFLALIAVIYIIIAGIRLIVSQGEEEQMTKSKKTIIYVIVGLLVILFARVIVSFFTETVPEQI